MNVELLLLETVCSTLHIGKSTAYRLLKSGQLPAYKIGRKWLVSRQVLDNYMKEHCPDQKND